jgi:ubiquinone/menaquinone biosynthesis C-methylase UbiE
MNIDPAIRDYYDRTPEETRLDLRRSQLERDRTRELILRHAPKPPAVVLDVGGAAGVHAFWLAELGYEVHLIDATPRLVQVARAKNADGGARLASGRVGDARAIDASDGFANVVLMLGPLYHLVRADDRRAAIAEALRVLRPGGLLVAAGISRWASVLDGLSRELFQDAEFGRIAERDLRDGNHLNPSGEANYFTTAYFHRPEDLHTEVADAGFDDVHLYGIEGPGWILTDFDDRWTDPTRREILLNVARALESEPAMIGCSAHLLAVGSKPTI